MKILVIGNGAREHAITDKILQNKNVEKVFAAKGNAFENLYKNVENVNLSNIEEIANFALKNEISLSIVGSEELLAGGIVDEFNKRGLKIIGPDKKAALLESSKAYAKDFMKKYGIKTAWYKVFDDYEKVKSYLENCKYPIVIKASGLAEGKGVFIVQDNIEAFKALNELMKDKIFGKSGEKIVVEEFLQGVEASILSITDSKTIIPFISAKDHKKIGENDTGLNTGGMGAIAPNPYVNEGVKKEFYNEILLPTLKGINEENLDFCGFIFFGLMINEKGVYLLEYNMRLGDPETQVVLPLLQNDFVEICFKALDKKLSNIRLNWLSKYACCVVLASDGYPLKYEKGFEISGLNDTNAKIFMAGVKEKNGKFLTNGGRVLNVLALANSSELARKKAYEELAKIDFENKYYRKDIGKI